MESLILCPRSARTHMALSRCYLAQGRPEEAKSYADLPRECGPELPWQPLVLGLDWTLEL